MLHAIFLYWAIGFPFSYRKFRLKNRVRSAHILCVIFALILPLPGALVHLKDGYVYPTTPVYACLGRNFELTYYTLIVPVSIALCTTACLLVLVFWKIFKVKLISPLLCCSMHKQSE